MSISLSIKGNKRRKFGRVASLLLFVGTATIFLHGRRYGSRSLADPSDESFELHSLNWASFGSSHTWGANLDDRNMAYPFLLSPNVKNLAIRAHDLTYPSLCISSMIGDEILDVVTIEGGWSSGGPGNHLAKRLRQRSPDLIIVFWNTCIH